MQKDEYEKALAEIYSVTKKLSGGYYEPKSERDRMLALELIELLEKHVNKNSNYLDYL